MKKFNLVLGLALPFMFLSSVNASSHKLTIKINPINNQAKTITGKTTKGTNITLYEGQKTIAKKKSSGNFSIKVTKPLNFKNKYQLLATKKGYTSKKISLKIIVKEINYDAKIKQINAKITAIKNQIKPLNQQVQTMEPFVNALENDDPTSSDYQTALQQANGNAETYENQYNNLKVQIKADSNPLGLLYDQRQAYIYKSMEQYNGKVQL
ncbi:hypothetical protein [Lentilactobacillus diolivorans]|uniref:Bacterial Ig domain-containing protein n=2 Tax=Lentilactobacillus diolivorans TaxID=179838 RepID=A0A0R1SHF9_9LACO|nr:hypothetical protein [Lentilactobacillus diolivorans]KRL65874.1 hypothetical protein FC85_GL003037 [Lentilactobacillus diolivorans DSM 14421]GEP25311.1 hypothetical protein LDI01_29040 [Lentilactobacillus diolivorans]